MLDLTITADDTTLRRHLTGRPFAQSRDMSSVPCMHVAKATAKFMGDDSDSKVRPETEALWFYMLNHVVSEVLRKYSMDDALPDAVLEMVREYNDQCAPKAARAFYYLLLICTREARHVSNNGATFWNEVQSKFGVSARNFGQALKGIGGSTSAYHKFLHEAPDTSIGEYVSMLRYVFYKGSFGLGYGGKKWAKVCDCLVEFVHGRYSPEMMLDTVWTLCHNGGPIFNKGMLYGMYSLELVKILDVQRSGQIPKMVGNSEVEAKFSPPALSIAWSRCNKLFPETFAGHVDWFLVEHLGSVHRYATEKQAQVAAHGPSDLATKISDMATKKAQALQEATYKVDHLLTVPKIKLDRVA